MSATVTLHEAQLEAAQRAARLVAVLGPLWRSARRWTAAVVLALFPFIFLAGRWFHFAMSPVLPGLIVLALVLVGLPFLLIEVSSRRYRRRDGEWQARRAARSLQVANAALLVAAVWLVLWFAVGL